MDPVSENRCHICNTRPHPRHDAAPFDVKLREIEGALIMLCDWCWTCLAGYGELTLEWVERYRRMGKQTGHITFDWPPAESADEFSLPAELEAMKGEMTWNTGH